MILLRWEKLGNLLQGVCELLFNSYVFILLYLPIVLLVYYGLSRFRRVRAATVWLVLASFFFYGYWDVRYVPLLFGSICWNYCFGQQIETTIRKRLLLTIAISGNIALLAYFKYAGFFLETINAAFGFSYDIPHIILPLGISFFTFTQTAYLLDVYRGETRRHGGTFLYYMLFVTIFPHLITGPIINYRNMMPQFTRLRNFVVNYRNLSYGLTLFVIGLFKKVYIADWLAPWAASAFSCTDGLGVIDAWAAALSYTYQLYFDFSGYSEMAIGLGLMLNYRFPVNFDSPYQAKSVIDFWRRWHMTLGAWVRDYLYIPLGGNRQGEYRKLFNLFLCMTIIGLWHGAGWTFVFWGALHGIFLVFNHLWRRTGMSLPKPLCWGLTFLCVVICWVFFRAETFADGWQIVSAMFGLSTPTSLWNMPDSRAKLLRVLFVLTAVLACAPNPQRFLEKHFRPSKVWALAVIALALMALTHLTRYSEFLYFQF